MQPRDLAPSVFSTVGLPAARRVELWELHNASALIGLDVHANAPLQATEVNVRLSRVQVARVAGSAHAVERSEDVIGRTPREAIAVYFALRGDTWFSQQGGTYALHPGDVLICETDRPFARGFAAGLEELVITAPRTALTAQPSAQPFRSPAFAAFGPGCEGDQYAGALAKLAARATRPVRPVRPDERTVLELVTVLALGPQAARSAAYRAAARSFIEDRLTDPGLGADQVAAAIGISERHLSRLLAADGTSVPKYILSRRLELAHAMLAGPTGAGASGHGDATVADIAAGCGFLSATYFSHVFRARFGRRAGEVLREARTACA
jgi:AraC-like DNA-binding protein